MPQAISLPRSQPLCSSRLSGPPCECLASDSALLSLLLFFAFSKLQQQVKNQMHTNYHWLAAFMCAVTAAVRGELRHRQRPQGPPDTHTPAKVGQAHQ